MNRTIVLLVLLASFSCTKNIDIDQFDSKKFKAAYRACDSSRIDLITPLKEKQELLVGASESTIKSLLGKPDKQEILKRMGRKYFYYLTPNSKCNNKIISPSSIIVEFEHTGRVKLILIPNKEAILAKNVSNHL